MTVEELKQKLQELQKCGDPEAAHSYADDALLEYINDPHVTEFYNAIDKWYA